MNDDHEFMTTSILPERLRQSKDIDYIELSEDKNKMRNSV